MLVMRTIENLTDPVGEFVSAEQSVGLYNLALAVDPFGSMALSHGLRFGRRQLTILTPQPLFLTSRLCFPSYLLSSRLMCQLALSQMRTNTFLPISSSFSQHHERNRVVMELTGRPSTNLSHVSSSSGR
jgi:hypothetical protein